MTKQQTLISMISVLVILTAGAFWLVSRDNYSAIFQNLEEHQNSAIESYLSGKGVPFLRDKETQQILVNEDLKHQIRMDLFSDGVINENRVGFEIFNDSDYGITEFAQKVNFQRALQGELEKTISAIEGVRNVRVHLKMDAKKQLFSKDKPVTASVVIYQKVGTQLNNARIKGIKRLVAGAVTDLEEKYVFITDSTGMSLGNSNSEETHYSGESGIVDEHEQKLMNHATRVLTALYDPKDFKVSVSVELDMNSRTTETESIPNLGQGAKIKEKRTRQVYADKSGQVRDANPIEEEVEYQYGKQIERISFAPGKTLKVSVGVVILDSQLNSNTAIVNLLWASLGLNKERGDNIEVMISKAKPEPIEERKDVSTPNIESSEPSSEWYRENRTLVISNIVFMFFSLLLIILLLRAKNKKAFVLTQDQETLILTDLREWVKHG